MSVSRESVVELLRSLGYPDVAEEADRDLPDPVDTEQAIAFGDRHGITRGELIDRMGGSP
jgi:hypothetical protein